jgi:isoquinoline 1-oxidoreductase subunit alpha
MRPQWLRVLQPFQFRAMTQFTLNGKAVSTTAAADKPLLWVLREDLALTGTKFGCGVAQCGACTVHVNGQPQRACVTPVSAVAGAQVTTIEGLVQSREGKALQAAWIAESAPQCGYCQSGQMMAAAAVLKDAKAALSREQVLERMNGNVCRCATYNQIAAAVVRAQKTLA